MVRRQNVLPSSSDRRLTFEYRLIPIVRTKGDQSQNVTEHYGKPNLVSETFCLVPSHQPENAKKNKKDENKKYINTIIYFRIHLNVT